MAFIGSQSMGQIGSGKIFISGFGSISTMGGQTEVSGGPTTITNDMDKFMSGSFGLGGGYFINDNISVGVSLMFSGTKLTPADTADPEVKTSGMGIGLNARYYVPVSDKFYFFGNLGYGMMNSGGTSTQGGTETELPKTSMNMVGLSPGFTWFATENLAFDMTWGNLGWYSSKTESTAGTITTTSTTSGMDVSFDLTSVSFGVMYFLK
ncbi:MAG: porin family protein [Bacteroidota bacterium]|nr:porin family protein [Bacteroidota bacterium]MDX5429602.1 porin family protein [Bacteroidota bacterium]MDX5468386.1 porin family protein [Bacteroidota bacterium]